MAGATQNIENMRKVALHHHGQVGIPLISIPGSDLEGTSVTCVPGVLHIDLRISAVLTCLALECAFAEGKGEKMLAGLRSFRIKANFSHPNAQQPNRVAVNYHGKDVERVWKSMPKILETIFLAEEDADMQCIGEAFTLAWGMMSEFVAMVTSHRTTCKCWLDMLLLGLGAGMTLSALVHPKRITPTIHEAIQHNWVFVRNLYWVEKRLGLVPYSLSGYSGGEYGSESVNKERTRYFTQNSNRGGGKKNKVDRLAEVGNLASGRNASVAASQLIRVFRREWISRARRFGNPQKDAAAVALARIERHKKGEKSRAEYGDPPSHDGFPALPQHASQDRGDLTVAEEAGGGDGEAEDEAEGLGDAQKTEERAELENLGAAAKGAMSESDNDDDNDDEGDEDLFSAMRGADADIAALAGMDQIVDSDKAEAGASGASVVFGQLRSSWASPDAPMTHTKTSGEDLSSPTPLGMLKSKNTVVEVTVGGTVVFDVGAEVVVVKLDTRNRRVVIEGAPRSGEGPKRCVRMLHVACLNFVKNSDGDTLQIRLRAPPSCWVQYDKKTIATDKKKPVTSASRGKRQSRFAWPAQASNDWTTSRASLTYSMWIVTGKPGCFDDMREMVLPRWSEAELADEDWLGTPTFELDRRNGKIPQVMGLNPDVFPVRSHPGLSLKCVRAIQQVVQDARKRAPDVISGDILFAPLVQGSQPLDFVYDMIRACKHILLENESAIQSTAPRVTGGDGNDFAGEEDEESVTAEAGDVAMAGAAAEDDARSVSVTGAAPQEGGEAMEVDE